MPLKGIFKELRMKSVIFAKLLLLDISAPQKIFSSPPQIPQFAETPPGPSAPPGLSPPLLGIFNEKPIPPPSPAPQTPPSPHRAGKKKSETSTKFLF